MGFENDYNAFFKALKTCNALEAESIFAQSDEKSFFIKKALDEFTSDELLFIVNTFRSLGLKNQIIDLVSKENTNTTKNDNKYKKTKKVVLVHNKNKMRNKIKHLSGNSFENEKTFQESIFA